MRHLIGILGYNSQPRLDKCAASVLADMPDDSALIVCDNGETPLLQPPGAVAYYVRDATAGGFTEALRWFLRRAQDEGCATATFLNDDLFLEPGCLRAMIDGAINEPHVALAAPMQVAMGNTQIVICGGTGRAIGLDSQGRPIGGGIHKTGQRGVAWREPNDCRWMPFAAVTFNVAAVWDIGLPDRNMVLWFSDSDYCIRARLAGYRIRYLGEQAVVQHEQSAAINGMETDARRVRFTADMLAFKRKWGGDVLRDYST